MIRQLFAAALLAFAATSAAAQDAPQSAQCELHVWPAANMISVRHHGIEPGHAQGLIPALMEEGQMRHDERAKQAFDAASPETLPAAKQIELLSALPLPTMLGLKDYRVVMHDTPLDSHTIRTVTARYVESAAPCYADLVLDDNVYVRAYANGKVLKTLFRFRDFGSGTAPVRSFGTWVQTRLTLFSIDPLNISQPALDELAAALTNNTTLFSGLLSKRP